MSLVKTIEPYKWPVSKRRGPGRPSKYRPDVMKQLDRYLELCQDRLDIRTLTWDVHLPTVEEFAIRLGVSRDTLYALAKKHSNYATALESLKSEQFLRLINGGLSYRYKAWLVILLLKTNHGWGAKKRESKAVRVLQTLSGDLG